VQIVGEKLIECIVAAAMLALANEAENHTIGNVLKEGNKLAYNVVFAIAEWNVSVWKYLFEGEVTDNDLSAVTDELELTPLAEQARLALNLSTKNVHGMVDFSMWRLKLPSDSVIIDYPVDIPKNNGVIIFPKPDTEKPKLEGVPATPQTPTVIIEYPPKVPDFTGIESFPVTEEENVKIINTKANNETGIEYTYANGVYEKANYHGKNDNSVKSKAPIDGQAALDNSIPLKDTTDRRVGISNGEIVILDKTSEGVYHGHVRSWDDLSEKMKAVLRKAGLVNKKGKIIDNE
jgi:hypothetical protein